MSDMTPDAIIIGSGPGGATAAEVLTRAGWSVVIMEKGRNHLLDPDDLTKPAGDYSNDEIKFVNRYFLGPDPLIEPRAFRVSADDGEHTHVGEVNSIPTTVGGGGTHADGKVPRFREEDFRLLSTYGPQEDAAVDDWPLDYDEMEPYYAEVERAIGVSGREGANPFAAWRSGPYPMPSGAPMYGARPVLGGSNADRPASLRGPDGRQQHRLRRAARLQQLWVLRLLRLPDPRQGRPRRAVDQGHGHRQGRADGRDLRQPHHHRRPQGHWRRVHRCRGRLAHDGRQAGDRGGWCHRDTAHPAALGDRAPLHRPPPHGALPDDRGRALPDPAPAPAQGPRGDPRARRRDGAGRGVTPGGGGCGVAVVPRRLGGAQRRWLPDHGGASLALGRPPRPSHARLEPARADVGVHHARRGPGLRHQHGRPEPVHPRRPRLPGGAGHLQPGPSRAGGVEVPRQDPAVGARGDGGRVGPAHLLARRLLPRHRLHTGSREPPRHRHGAHGRRSRDIGRGPVGSGALARQRRDRGLVGLRDRDRLRPDADAGGPGVARGPSPGGDEAHA